MNLDNAYALAREIYAEIGVDTDAAMAKLKTVPVSVHCWQIDDVGGFENPDQALSGGIAAFGNAPGKPAGRDEYFEQLARALSLVPG